MRYDFPLFMIKIKTAVCQKSSFLPQRTQRKTREKKKQKKISVLLCVLCGKKKSGNKITARKFQPNLKIIL